MPAAEKPEPKLIGVVPLWIVIADVAVALVAKFVAVAMAFTVVVALTVNEPVYGVEDVVGWFPFRV
jgi:hypothetical protein